ncbi:unnamed protein product [Haemonchus placei]|uniref:Uncharacterized protein n=1 Tax=Haemonchus placei TaxID=6290 RepID=A0A0N4X7K0_HAEPC|nr:unnamed protein product [Haemonchus placei]
MPSSDDPVNGAIFGEGESWANIAMIGIAFNRLPTAVKDSFSLDDKEALSSLKRCARAEVCERASLHTCVIAAEAAWRSAFPSLTCNTAESSNLERELSNGAVTEP